jgi:hypothetical protein
MMWLRILACTSSDSQEAKDSHIAILVLKDAYFRFLEDLLSPSFALRLSDRSAIC